MVADWCAANPDKKGLLLCVEICSAIYTFDDSLDTALVNSLFGDGVAAVLLSAQASGPSPKVLAFESHVIPGTLSALRFDWKDALHRNSFVVERDAPRALARAIEIPVQKLLARHRLTRADVRHWVFHTGGAAILDGIRERLRLSLHDLRHTREILRNFGNLSSASVFFSLDELQKEGVAREGGYGVMVSMGPGLTIEAALLRW